MACAPRHNSLDRLGKVVPHTQTTSASVACGAVIDRARSSIAVDRLPHRHVGRRFSCSTLSAAERLTNPMKQSLIEFLRRPHFVHSRNTVSSMHYRKFCCSNSVPEQKRPNSARYIRTIDCSRPHAALILSPDWERPQRCSSVCRFPGERADHARNRDNDPRSDERDRSESWDRSFSSRGSTDRERHEGRDPRDVFIRDLDVPRERERRPVRDRDRVYEISGDESRMLGTIGAFRVVSEHDLLDVRDETSNPRRSARHLEDEDLIRSSPLSSDDRAVVPDRARSGSPRSQPLRTPRAQLRTPPDRSTPASGSRAS